MNRFLSIGARFVLSALATATLAQEPPKASVLKPLTPEASLSLRSISDLQFSPDGNRLAFVITEPAKGERRALLAVGRPGKILHVALSFGQGARFAAVRTHSVDLLENPKPSPTPNGKSAKPC